jgi:hypothetical protein
MMLRAPNAAGISSPVGGMDGALPIRGMGSAVRSADDRAETIASPAAEMVDLRWVGARLARPVTYRNGLVAGGGSVLAMAASVPAGNVVGLSSADVSVASIPAQEAAVGTVVGMLRGWGAAAASSGDARRDGVRSDVR